METLDAFRISVGAAAERDGAARARRDAATTCKARVQFGKPLAEQQIVQAHLAEMATELDAARLLVARAAHAQRHAATTRVSTEAAMAKLYATEAAQRIIDHAVQLHGGLGVIDEPRSSASIARSARSASTRGRPRSRSSSSAARASRSVAPPRASALDRRRRHAVMGAGRSGRPFA